MKRIEFSEILPYSAVDIYRIAMDAKRYPEATSWIKNVETEDRKAGNGNLIRHIDVAFGLPFIPFSFTYAAELEAAVSENKIIARPVRSPFRSIQGELNFKTLENGHTKVSGLVEYETGPKWKARILAKFLKGEISTGIQYAKDYLKKLERNGELERLPGKPAAPAPAAL